MIKKSVSVRNDKSKNKEIKKEIEAHKEENKKDKKDYEKIYNQRIGLEEKKSEVLTKEELMKQNPNMTEEQINDLLSRQSEQAIGDNLFDDDKKDNGNLKLSFSFKELKGEKIYKKYNI